MRKLLLALYSLSFTSTFNLNVTSCAVFHRKNSVSKIVNKINDAENITAKGFNLNNDSGTEITKKNIY